MQFSFLYHRAFSAVKIQAGLYNSGPENMVPSLFHPTSQNPIKFFLVRIDVPPILRSLKLEGRKTKHRFQPVECSSLLDENQGELSDIDEYDEQCPVDCVREFKTDKEFLKILEKSKKINSLVVVDFYRTSCGSCKYIEQGFAKLCKGSRDQEGAVIFLKHNVVDEYDEQSEVAERLRIRSVPLFHFYKDGTLLEAFPTRDKERILDAIQKYTTPAVS